VGKTMSKLSSLYNKFRRFSYSSCFIVPPKLKCNVPMYEFVHQSWLIKYVNTLIVTSTCFYRSGFKMQQFFTTCSISLPRSLLICNIYSKKKYALYYCTFPTVIKLALKPMENDTDIKSIPSSSSQKSQGN